MSTVNIFFLHRQGLKIYQIKNGTEPVEVTSIDSLDPSILIQKCSTYFGQTIRLLVADSICYLLQSQLPPDNSPLTREKILANIKVEIPESFERFDWDYKIDTQDKTGTSITVFAPVGQYQQLIFTLAEKLKLNVEAIEPESIAASRHSNPILGLYQKQDMAAADQDTLNIEINDSQGRSPGNFLKIFGFILFLILFAGANYYLYLKLISPSTASPAAATTPTPSPVAVTVTVTPSSSIKFSDLKLSVQNGSGIPGLASKVAQKFISAGVISVDTRNADRNDYLESRLIFKNETFKNQFTTNITAVFSIATANILIDNSAIFDAILILGKN